MSADRTDEHPNPLLRAVLGRCGHPGCTREIVATVRSGDTFPPPRVACEAGHLWPFRSRRAAPASIRAVHRHEAA